MTGGTVVQLPRNSWNTILFHLLMLPPSWDFWRSTFLVEIHPQHQCGKPLWSQQQIANCSVISDFPEPGLILSFTFLQPQFLDSQCWDQKRYPKSRSRFFPAPTGPLVGETGTNSWLLPVTAIHDWLPLFWPLQTCLLIKSYLSSFSFGTFLYDRQAFILNTTPAKAVLSCACPVEFDWDRHESGFRPRISDCRSRQPASKYMGMFSDERLTYFQSETQRVRQSRHLG